MLCAHYILVSSNLAPTYGVGYHLSSRVTEQLVEVSTCKKRVVYDIIIIVIKYKLFVTCLEEKHGLWRSRGGDRSDGKTRVNRPRRMRFSRRISSIFSSTFKICSKLIIFIFKHNLFHIPVLNIVSHSISLCVNHRFIW